MQAGPYRTVSLITREAADELKLERRSAAVASINAYDVTIRAH
jgi:molybdopterin-binding protein